MVVPEVYNNDDHQNELFLLHSEPVSGLHIGSGLELTFHNKGLFIVWGHLFTQF